MTTSERRVKRPSVELAEAARLLDQCDRDLVLNRFGYQLLAIPDGVDFLRRWMSEAAVDLEGVTDPPATVLDADILEPRRPLIVLARRIRQHLGTRSR
ncbi:hypothetical protein [Prauserella endophytica]|uniref:Uncharacterized protein n=1 Tax=Prauserella endophytica TaxID=1592324 RepID=A0ABY2RZU3_9PSEU|nr:hypothetical protein [Prauserella endophytica]PXY20301.1 hypothetical protein BAY59_31165 [Prauserella coralliicola]TKG66903.1 hypothetical protein FCN18_23605 [Prauserella endophytica]